MPSIVENIVVNTETTIEALLPEYRRSPYVYNVELNNRETSKAVYSVRPSTAINVQTVMRSITLDQSFEVSFTRAYLNKDMNDLSLQAKIFKISEDHETLYREVMLRRLNLVNVLIVQNVDIEAPEINEDDEYVTITAVYTVKYRSEITV